MSNRSHMPTMNTCDVVPLSTDGHNFVRAKSVT